MKRFTISILCVSVFFIGLGALTDSVGAKFKSDEKALALIKQARLALGGDAALAEVRSLVIVGKSSQTFKIDGVERTEQGETEIALQLPDKLMKMIRIGNHVGAEAGEKIMNKQVDVVVLRDDKDAKPLLDGENSENANRDGVKKIIIKKGNGTTEELNGSDHKIILRKGATDEGGKTAVFEKEIEARHGAMRQNELLRTAFSLLLTAPDGLDVSYQFGGETDVDGTTCNIVVAEFGGSSFKLFLNRASSLPVMMTYQGHKMPKIVKMRSDAPKSADGEKDTVIFTRKLAGPDAETAEFQVRFSDYRSVNGIQLPYKWTRTVGGQADETLDVTSYEINPANIAEKFGHQKAFVRTKKAEH